MAESDYEKRPGDTSIPPRATSPPSPGTSLAPRGRLHSMSPVVTLIPRPLCHCVSIPSPPVTVTPSPLCHHSPSCGDNPLFPCPPVVTLPPPLLCHTPPTRCPLSCHQHLSVTSAMQWGGRGGCCLPSLTHHCTDVPCVPAESLRSFLRQRRWGRYDTEGTRRRADEQQQRWAQEAALAAALPPWCPLPSPATGTTLQTCHHHVRWYVSPNCPQMSPSVVPKHPPTPGLTLTSPHRPN